MSKNYFSIERNGMCWTPVFLSDHNGDPVFQDFIDMSYNEIKSSDKLSSFVVAAMDAANRKTESKDDLTVVTLVGEDDFFIWSIVMGPDKNNEIRYSIVDWKSDGKIYRYEQ